VRQFGFIAGAGLGRRGWGGMGVQLGEIVPREEMGFDRLKGLALAIDAYNALYQFLSIIRGPDGTPLRNRRGQVTSHLSGLFFRTCNLLKEGVKPVYVFDGKPPSLKREEVARRQRAREEARRRYEEAIREGRVEEARVAAQAATTLTDYMVETGKELLSRMGVPVVQAPSEGEAQAAQLAERGLVWAACSQDYDSLLFGAPRLARNITITGRRRLPRRNAYIEVKPELVELERVLSALQVTREQLITIGLLVGTDFTPGVRGLGPKTALKLVKEGLSPGEVYARFGVEPPPQFEEAKGFFLKPSVAEVEKLEWREMDERAVVEYLRDEHDFSEQRVVKAIQEVKAQTRASAEEGTLSRWF